MSENASPSGTAQPSASSEQAEGSTRRRALLLGGVVAVLLAGGASFVLGGQAEEDVAPLQRAAPAVPAAATPAAVSALPAPFDEDLGRDPFRALYVVPVAAAAAPVEAADPTLPQGSSTSTGEPVAAADPPVLPGPGPTGSGSGSAPAAAPVAPEGPTAREYALVLKRVYGTGKDQTAEFTIDGRKVVAQIGVRFGPTSEIRLIDLEQGPASGGWTAVLQVGDGEPFDAVTGKKVSVR